MKVKLKLSNYATKADLKGPKSVDTSKKSNLVNKINVDKIKTVPFDLSKVRNVVT